MKKILCISIVLALNGCALLPTYERPETQLPESFKANQASNSDASQTINQQWWKNFGDPVLDNMIDNALRYNQDLVAAQARVKEAAANAGIARSALFPSIDGAGNFTRQRTSQETTAPGTPIIGDVRTAYAQLSWEIDIWGKLAAQNKAARAQFLSSQYNRDALQLSIAAQVANTYFQLRTVDEQLALTEKTLASREETLALYQKQFKHGLISALTLNQMTALTAAARADVPRLKLSKEQTEHALAILIGQTPEQMVNDQITRGAGVFAQNLKDTIPEGLPSDLLVRRADIRAAEEMLIAAHADVGVARVAYLPSIGLTSAIGSQSLSLDSLFTAPTRTWNFVGNLTTPIFNAGRIGYNIRAAKAREEQAVSSYQKAIQTAFRDTLDALSEHKNDKDIEDALRTQLKATSESARLSRIQYDHGYTDYLTVLDSERSLYQTQMAVVNARLARLNAMVSLYKALGGGWDEKNSKAYPTSTTHSQN
ncbi:efflux transporter outer membrane subunit [Neisseria sp. Ec49-e6-T10]|uniref:efflux transporter outer membrane subunit n=1 Tax=Neisseria sp. Ec49-e6-T10 TaxID=3140744 RepID=UPI003EB90B63